MTGTQPWRQRVGGTEVPQDRRCRDIGDGGAEEIQTRLRAQWHLLVQNDTLFGPQYALIGATAQLALVERLLVDVPRSFRPSVVRLAAQYAESAAWLNQSLDDAPAAHHCPRDILSCR
ncbi:hypothetical protein AB0K20_29350 [Micromonospora matsumotoense]|uniref:hypothetical protein n=1 Tax=Micromonospora matsumotoense TaxID=121616 RepID=UPI00343E8AC9